jgi:hypothetical protein
VKSYTEAIGLLADFLLHHEACVDPRDHLAQPGAKIALTR